MATKKAPTGSHPMIPGKGKSPGKLPAKPVAPTPAKPRPMKGGC